MNETHGKLSTMCGLFALWMVLVLVGAPIAARADQAPGYEKYQEGYEGYVGDGILKKGEDEEAELAHAVQNPVADMISFPLTEQYQFQLWPARANTECLEYSARHSRRCDRGVAYGHPHHSAPGFATRVSAQSGPEFGLGDTLFSALFSPKDRNLWLGNWLWGAGPAILLPTSTQDRLGVGEVGAAVCGYPDHARAMGNRFTVQQCVVLHGG